MKQLVDIKWVDALIKILLLCGVLMLYGYFCYLWEKPKILEKERLEIARYESKEAELSLARAAENKKEISDIYARYGYTRDSRITNYPLSGIDRITWLELIDQDRIKKLEAENRMPWTVRGYLRELEFPSSSCYENEIRYLKYNSITNKSFIQKVIYGYKSLLRIEP